MPKLKKEFYRREDTLAVARDLLGKKLVSFANGQFTSGIICETEAYCGPEDRGCHAYNRRLTDRTKIMYSAGGVSYVYLCYGIHYLFNVITHTEDNPHAVLIRAIEPSDGMDIILKRRKTKKMHDGLGAGPGLVSQCLGFTTKHNGISLLENEIWIEDAKPIVPKNIIESARVGMNFEGPYKLIPWRFRIKNSPFSSKAK
ncbi:MAG: DNA-3-methyladenine glycosylase [Chitinophagales bacterium]